MAKTIKVPGNLDSGVRFDAPAPGIYDLAIIEGAYSGWPNDNPQGGSWRTIIHIYKNRSVEWGWRTWGTESYNEPVHPDYSIGQWNFDAWTTQDQASSAGKGMRINVQLSAGDFLIFVAIDEKLAYNYPAANRGDVTIEVAWLQ